jgi:hypothetical protein
MEFLVKLLGPHEQKSVERLPKMPRLSFNFFPVITNVKKQCQVSKLHCSMRELSQWRMTEMKANRHWADPKTSFFGACLKDYLARKKALSECTISVTGEKSLV